MERQTKSKNRYGRQMGALLLSTGLLFGHESTSEPVITEVMLAGNQSVTENIFSSFSYDSLDSQMLAGVVRDPTTNEYIFVKDQIPGPRNETFHRGVSNPIAELGRTSRTVNSIVVTKTNSENGWYDPKTHGITILMSTSPYATSNMIKNPKVVPKIIDHEVTHALNNEWNQDLFLQNKPKDPLLAVKISRVASACIAMNKSILADFIDENRTEVASTFEQAGEKVKASRMLVDIQADDYQLSMQESADAVRSNNPIIYDGIGLSDPSCQDIDIRSLANGATGSRSSSVDFESVYTSELLEMQYQLEWMSQKAFACITEGKALSELLDDITPMNAGHPQDNPTEMASSIITTLSSNPDYFTSCLQKIPQQRKDALLAYMAAEVDLMNYTHPELITIIRRDAAVDKILDTLVTIDKQQ